MRENFVERLWEMNVDTHMIVGNHDIYYKNTNQVNSLTELLVLAPDHILGTGSMQAQESKSLTVLKFS